uniref:Putative secreted protein n=1 Tax=Amblyomma triste TaxID=251400 RepID=A0A023G270_AMBTT
MDNKTWHVLFVLVVLKSTLFYSSGLDCKKNEAPHICTRRRIQEARCPGVMPTVCHARVGVCRCVAGTFRNSDGECDDLSKCNTEERSRQRQLQQQNNHTYYHALQVIESADDLHLLMIFMNAPQKQMCKCMKSAFLQCMEPGAERTMDCYLEMELPNKPTVLIKSSVSLEFALTKGDKETHMQLTPVRQAQLPFQLQASYKVLSAQPTCLVLKIGEEEDGKQRCMLWGLVNDEIKDEQDCFDAMKYLCVKNNFDVWQQNERCLEHDKLAEAARKKTTKRRHKTTCSFVIQ